MDAAELEARTHCSSSSTPLIVLYSLDHGGVSVCESPVLDLHKHQFHRLKREDVNSPPVEWILSIIAVPIVLVQPVHSLVAALHKYLLQTLLINAVQELD